MALDTINKLSPSWQGETTLLSDIFSRWISASPLLQYIRRLEFLPFEVDVGKLESARQEKLAQLRTQLLPNLYHSDSAKNPRSFVYNQHLLIKEEVINWISNYTVPQKRFPKLKYFAPKISLIILGLGAAVMAAWGAVILSAPVFLAVPFGVLVIWFALAFFASLAFTLITIMPYIIANSLLEKKMMAEVSAAVENRMQVNNGATLSDSKDQILSDLPAALDSPLEENKTKTPTLPSHLAHSPELQGSQTSGSPLLSKKENSPLRGMPKDS